MGREAEEVGTSEPPGGHARPWAVLAILAPTWLLVRVAALLSVAPDLYDREWLHLGASVWRSRGGEALGEPTALGYMAWAPGTALLEWLAACLSPALGQSVWAVHAAGLGLELLGFVGAVWLVAVCRGSRAALLTGLVLVLAPSFVLRWELLPFGNHTEFLVFPVLVALAVRGDPSWSRDLGAVLAAAVGAFLYRGDILLFPALAVLGLSRRAGRARLLCLTAAGLVAVILGAAAYAGSSVGDLSALLPSAAMKDLSPRWASVVATASSLFGLQDQGGPLQLAHGAGLGLVLVAAVLSPPQARGRAPVIILAVSALGRLAGLWVQDAPPDHYTLPSYYQLVLCAGLIPPRISVLRSLRSAGLILLLVGGLLGGVSPLIQPGRWETNVRYDGLQLRYGMGLPVLDPVWLPQLRRITAEGLATPALGLGIPEGHCDPSIRYRETRISRGGSATRCGCWDRGELAARVAEVMAAGGGTSLPAVGQGAWIACTERRSAVERALEGLDSVTREEVLRGATRHPDW